MEETNVQTEAMEQVQETANANVAASGKSYTDKIKDVLKRGGKRYNSLRVRNVCTELTDSDYVRITFVCDKSIPGYTIQDDGTYKEGIINNIFSSSYAIAGMLKEDEELAWLANEILLACDKATEEQEEKYLGMINLLFNGATIDVLSEHVKENQEYYNPFTTREDVEAYIPDHDTYINNVVKIKLGKTGQIAANKLMDKLLGF